MQHFIGCDVHARNQVVAWIDEETGRDQEAAVGHEGKK